MLVRFYTSNGILLYDLLLTAAAKQLPYCTTRVIIVEYIYYVPLECTCVNRKSLSWLVCSTDNERNVLSRRVFGRFVYHTDPFANDLPRGA